MTFNTVSKDITFQDAVSAAGNGSEFLVSAKEAYKTITVEITGTSTSRTIAFEGKSTSGTWYPIMGVRLSDFAMATQTTGKGEIWQFDVTGLDSFRSRLASVAGGNVTVKGKAVL